MMLRIMGFVLCAALVASVDVNPQKDFNLEKMAGRWWIVGFASNAQWFVSRNGTMKMGTTTMLPTAEGDLGLVYANEDSDGSCWSNEYVAQKTDTPGRFTYTSQAWNNENDINVVDVQYDDFALLHTIKTQNGTSEILNELYSRTQEVSAELQEKFRQFSLGTGILSENIAILPKTDKCVGL